jgi:hypothetical protein
MQQFLVRIDVSNQWATIHLRDCRHARDQDAAPGDGHGHRDGDGHVLDVSTLMGSVERGMSTQDFRGGSVSAVMAGCEIDLRKASIESHEAVLNAFALWGGIEIKVPSDWTVESRGVAVMGAFEDSSRRPDDPRKKLIVTGYALMGGVEVKN